ncbi:hypothetical protein FE257_001493 [Aspergillus nanangensis]|uniref:SGNH hydrolase-type esterase domain-containing protein n=1 Tax=Aspergillus nanangensis TaxID=2582783 RepID=A0AAD4GQM9_ASPNN|nr:hypothetical protein FE257_001493 [Aspergillus nanangensis]
MSLEISFIQYFTTHQNIYCPKQPLRYVFLDESPQKPDMGRSSLHYMLCVELRILPLGDSITMGYKSSDGNGYREDLEKRLIHNSVDFIGTQHSGDMKDNAHEGHSGALIDAIADHARDILPKRPNVVLLMAGSNDCNRRKDVDHMPDRLGDLIDEITDACPDAAVIVAQLTPIENDESEAAVKKLNSAIPGLVSDRAKKGKKVLTVNMSATVTTNDLKDGLHPNDHGYNLMSEVWLEGIQSASDKGWIKKPVEV